MTIQNPKPNLNPFETLATFFTEERPPSPPLNRPVKLEVVTRRKTASVGDDGNQRRPGRPHIAIALSIGNRSVSLSTEELDWFVGRLEAATQAVIKAAEDLNTKERAFQERRQAERNRGPSNGTERFIPNGGRSGPMSPGKTARRKEVGKAGESYHRAKKAERAENDRQRAYSGGAGKKKN